MVDLKFSIGTVKLVDPITSEETAIGIAQEISVHYSGAAKEFRGGDYDYPADIKLGDKSCEVTAKTGYWKLDPSDIFNDAVFNLQITEGKEGGGSLGTITNLKLVDFKVDQKQNEYVVSDMTFHKITDLT